MIKFYKGDAAKYNPEEHGEGIYFTNDTSEILHNGISYSGKKDYTSSLEDKTLETAYDIGGIKKGTKVEDLEGKTYNDLFDEILFPTVYPTFIDPSATISLTNYNSVQEIGSSAPTRRNFTTNYDPGSINLNGVKQNNRGGDLDEGNSFIYVGEESTNLPTTVALGNTNYYYKAAYKEGPPPKDNKGNDYSPLGPGSVVSEAVTVNGTWPWFASTSSATLSNPVVKQALVAWNSSVGKMSTGEFETQPSGTLDQVFKIPREAQSVQVYDNGSGKWVTEAIATTYIKSTEDITINGNKRTYYVYTYNKASLGNRGSAKLKVNF